MSREIYRPIEFRPLTLADMEVCSGAHICE